LQADPAHQSPELHGGILAAGIALPVMPAKAILYCPNLRCLGVEGREIGESGVPFIKGTQKRETLGQTIPEQRKVETGYQVSFLLKT